MAQLSHKQRLQQIAAAYASGMRFSDILAKFHTTRETIANACREFHVARRGSGPQPKPKRDVVTTVNAALQAQSSEKTVHDLAFEFIQQLKEHLANLSIDKVEVYYDAKQKLQVRVLPSPQWIEVKFP